MSDETELNIKGLDQIIKALKNNVPVVQVGVLGSKNGRRGNGSNADIGARHEFGEGKLPIRSFLRMPLAEKLQEFLEKAGALDEEALKEVVKTGSFIQFAKKMGITAEAVIAEAFDTGGFGKWKPSIMDHKKNKQTLVETQQLRNSITSRVKQ